MQARSSGQVPVTATQLGISEPPQNPGTAATTTYEGGKSVSDETQPCSPITEHGNNRGVTYTAGNGLTSTQTVGSKALAVLTEQLGQYKGPFYSRAQWCDTLLAIAAVSIGSNFSPVEARTFDWSSAKLVGGPSKARTTNIRAFRVLDALASLSVSQPSHQVIATAVQIDQKGRLLTLTIAENNKFPSHETIKYLRGLWRRLQELAEAFAEGRRRGPTPEQWTNYEGLSPPVPEHPNGSIGIVTANGKVKLFEQIHLFTELKYEKRIRKYWALVYDFAQELLKSTWPAGPKAPVEKAVKDTFVEMTQMFHWGLTCIHNRDWEDGLSWMDTMLGLSETVLEHKVWCEDMVNKGINPRSWKRSDRYPLRRHIEKLTSHHRYITELIGFAHSPRLGNLLSLELRVIAVPPQRFKANVYLPPRTAADWKNALIKVSGGLGVLSERYLDRQSLDIYQRYVGRRITPTVHCECALIAHLEATRGSDQLGATGGRVPAFSYIGVSKLSCAPCTIWINAFREKTKRNYYTRGSHSRWYFPWRMPTVNSVDTGKGLEAATTKYLEEALRVLLNESARKAAKSDGTDASGSTVLERVEDREAEMKKLVAKRVATAGLGGPPPRLSRR